MLLREDTSVLPENLTTTTRCVLGEIQWDGATSVCVNVEIPEIQYVGLHEHQQCFAKDVQKYRKSNSQKPAFASGSVTLTHI